MRRLSLLFTIVLVLGVMPGCFSGGGGHGGGGGGNGGGGGGGGGPQPITVTLTPSTPQTLLPGATLSITSNVTVNWTLNQDHAGVLTNMAPNVVTYNAPFAVSTSVTDTVTATSTADPTKSATVKITTNPTTSFLFGQFAFLFTGFDANGAVSIAGSFTVDQHGNVTGEQDFKDPKTASSTPQTIAGTAANSPVADAGLLTITAGGKTSKYVFDLRASFFIGRFAEDPSDGTGVTGSGVLIVQDPTAFDLTSATSTAFNGNFSMGFVGTDAAGGRLSVVGTFFDDLGAHINGGEADVNDNSTLITQAKVAGALTGPVDSDGRATAQVTITGPSSVETLNLAFYIVDASSAFATDITLPGPTAQVLGGQLLAILPKNPAGQNGFGNTSLRGNTVFDLWGASAGPPVAADTTIGLLSVPGAGSPAVLVDMNNAGAVLTNQPGSVANISIDSFGRGTFDMTVNGQAQRSFVVYLDTTNDGFLQETTGTAVNFGFIQAQKGTFDNAHIFGTYASATFLPPVPNSPDFAGPVTLNPTGQSGSTFSGTFTAGKVTGNYSFDSASGRGTATSTNMPTKLGTNLAFYIITPGKIVVMGVDNGNLNDNIEYLVF